jgi:hypothetical protein
MSSLTHVRVVGGGLRNRIIDAGSGGAYVDFRVENISNSSIYMPDRLPFD